MNSLFKLSAVRKTIILALVVAEAGVVVQQLSGAPYALIPPVLFILLVPALIIAIFKKRWTRILSLLAGLFLVFGLFGSGAYHRLLNWSNPVDSAGLLIQMIAVLVALVCSVIALRFRETVSPGKASTR